MTISAASSWLKNPGTSARYRLFCFPYAQQTVAAAISPNSIQHQNHDNSKCECQPQDCMSGVVNMFAQGKVRICNIAQQDRQDYGQHIRKCLAGDHAAAKVSCCVPPVTRFWNTKSTTEKSRKMEYRARSNWRHERSVPLTALPGCGRYYAAKSPIWFTSTTPFH